MTKLEFIFPFIVVLLKNREVNKKLDSYNPEKSQTEWFNILKDVKISDSVIENISYNVYSAEDRRTYNIENKGSSLLIGIGVSISLLSIILGFLTSTQSISVLQLTAIIIFLIAIVNLILAAFGAGQAIKISIRHVSVSDELRNILKEKDEKIIRWAAEHLANVEYNLNLSVKKSNWVDVAQQHFVRGLGFIVLGFIVLVWDIVSSIISGSISLDGV